MVDPNWKFLCKDELLVTNCVVVSGWTSLSCFVELSKRFLLGFTELRIMRLFWGVGSKSSYLHVLRKGSGLCWWRGGKLVGLSTLRRFMGVFLKDPFIGEKTPVLPFGLVNEFSILIVWFILAWPLICRNELLIEDLASVAVTSYCELFMIFL